jgi:DNA-3-methyladenine glycosylase
MGCPQQQHPQRGGGAGRRRLLSIPSRGGRSGARSPGNSGAREGEDPRRTTMPPAPSPSMASRPSSSRDPPVPLGEAFFDRPAAQVARDLLGCRLRRALPGGALRVVRLVEVEAYVRGDPANHASRGMTPRNRSMFLGPGHLYVYGIHQVHCANLTARPGEAILLRAGEPLSPGLTNPSGPGRLSRELALTRAHDGSPLSDPFLAVLPREGAPPRILTGPRIGISRGTELPLRFFVADSPWVSGPRRGTRDRARGGDGGSPRAPTASPGGPVSERTGAPPPRPPRRRPSG